jgi:hypothetical protein
MANDELAMTSLATPVGKIAMTAAKIFVLAVLACWAAAWGADAGPASRLPGYGFVIAADWQSPQVLPRRFRNHCVLDADPARSYCSDNCGFDYQFYYCSRGSFGCCRIGFGYCDWSGLLRCHP